MFAGKTVTTKEQLVDFLSYYEPGEDVELTIEVPDGKEYKEETVTVTLGKKPKGAKGIQLTTTVQGISSYKTIKGKKNTFTANFNWDAPVSLKGRTASFKVKTYNNAKYKAYSYDSKPKKLKIK